jgi:hypothetical protein
LSLKRCIVSYVFLYTYILVNERTHFIRTFLSDTFMINNKCSIEMLIKLALTLFFKRQQRRKLSWLDKDSDKDQSQFDELFN